MYSVRNSDGNPDMNSEVPDCLYARHLTSSGVCAGGLSDYPAPVQNADGDSDLQPVDSGCRSDMLGQHLRGKVLSGETRYHSSVRG